MSVVERLIEGSTPWLQLYNTPSLAKIGGLSGIHSALTFRQPTPHPHPLANPPPSAQTRRTARANCEEAPLRNVTSQRRTGEGVATSDASPQGDIRRQDLANTWTVFDGDQMLLFCHSTL